MPNNTLGMVKEIFSGVDYDKVSSIQEYLDLLLKYHQTKNLIPSSDKDYILKREIYDSYQLIKHLKGNSYTDVGSGGGLPGVILSILNPGQKVILLDRKKAFINFLKLAKKHLKLENTEIVEVDFFDNEFDTKTDVIIFKNFSNKKISKMHFEEKLIYLLNNCKNSSQASRVYMLTGSPVLNLSKTFMNMYNININKIISPYFDTHRYIAEIKLWKFYL